MSTTRSLRRAFESTVGSNLRLVSRSVSPVGWIAVSAGLLSLVIGHVLGWTELTVLGAVLIVLFALAAPFALGQSDLEVELDLRPQSVTAGQRAVAQVTIRPSGGRTARGLSMELPVGQSMVEFPVPVLRQGAEHEEPFVLPTVRRGVITVGPVSSIRADPLSIVRRSQQWTDSLDLLVHPRVVRLLDTGNGFIRDLEGIASNQRSNADIAFHTLREYVPGDDPRHIHWLSTARSNTLMVRQFVDSRRMHLGLAVDAQPSSYGSEDDFELALSIAASIGARVLEEEQEVTCVVGDERLLSSSRRSLFDAMARYEVGPKPDALGATVAALLRASSGLSIAAVLTGSNTRLDDLRRSTLRFPPGIQVLVIRVDRAVATTYRPLGRQTLLSVKELDDLPQLLWRIAQ